MCIKVINDVNVNFNTIHIDEVNAWNSDYTSYYPDYLFKILKLSIKEIGVTVPINLVQKDNQWYCVDGLRRLDVVKQLKESNEWAHEYIPATVHSLENIENTYAACAFQKKELSISQKAFFAAKWHYEDVKKLAEENKKLNDEGKHVTKKINTSLIVAQRVGLKTADHVAKAYQLLQNDDWFYDFVYKQGFKFPCTEIKELVMALNDEESKQEGMTIIEKMKELAQNADPHEESVSIYKQAKAQVTIAENLAYNEDTNKYRDIDIDELTNTNENTGTSKSSFKLGKTHSNRDSHDKNAAKDRNRNKLNAKIKKLKVAVAIKGNSSEEEKEILMSAIKNSVKNVVLIETDQDWFDFKNQCTESSEEAEGSEQ